MIPKTIGSDWLRSAAMFAVAAALVLGLSAPAVAQESDAEEIADSDRSELGGAVRDWIKAQTEGTENQYGKKTKRGYYSRDYVPADDGTYRATAHIETAGAETKTTERYLLTLKKAAKGFEVADAQVQDAYAGLHRDAGYRCQPFDKLSFDREGLKFDGTNGGMCELYYQGRVAGMWIHADDASYSYAPPDHANALHLQPDFHSIFKTVKKDHTDQLVFDPAGFLVLCDPDSCDMLRDEIFTGIGPQAPDQAKAFDVDPGEQYAWARPWAANLAEDRRNSAFAHFREPVRPGNRTYDVLVARKIDPFNYAGAEDSLFDLAFDIPGPGIHLNYNNWGGYEVSFNVWPRRTDIPEQLFGTIYGYYTEETLKNSDPYEIERRDDVNARWHQVYSVQGEVDMGTDDPEILAADVTFGIELKQAMREIPFFIQSIPQRDFSGDNKARILRVNSVQLDGEELTWTKTGQLSGLVVLPEEMPAGTRLNIRMNFATRAMVKYNHAFTGMSRFGWMPFVRFADFIDDFEMTVRTPCAPDKTGQCQYKILGIGHKVSEKREGPLLVTHWKAENPVVFPTIIFGKYVSNDAGKYQATKLDGSVIPVGVHVDEVSMGQLAITVNTAETAETLQDFESGSRGIREKQLRSIATQAAVSINLFKELSGLDYPYGELNLVNDPAPALYGQAPSSLIYLGSLVFRGEGTMAGGGLFGGTGGSRSRGGATRTAKFLKSVVAHEVGHQWWGSRVSNANGRNYWFVESLAEYFSAIYLEQAFGPKEYQEQVDEWRADILDVRLKASVQNASAIFPGEDGFGSYRAAVYAKGPYAFHMLRETFGDEKFFDFLKKFTLELAEKQEIVTLDIQRAAEKALGGIDPEGNPYNVDLSWFFDQWIRGVGIPQYRLVYDMRQTEDGGYLIEGQVEQRVIVGSNRNHEVLEGTYYRGVVDITVDAKNGQSYQRRLVVEGPQTPFKLKVPKEPLEVALNKSGEILSHEVIVNKSWQ